MIDFNYTIIIQFANLLILMILLNVFLFKPVLKAISKRDDSINSKIEKAKLARNQVSTFKTSYEDMIKEKKKPIMEARDSVLNEVHATTMKTIENARLELIDEISRIRAEIENDSKKVRTELKKDVERLSNEVAQKILKRSFS